MKVNRNVDYNHLLSISFYPFSILILAQDYCLIGYESATLWEFAETYKMLAIPPLALTLTLRFRFSR